MRRQQTDRITESVLRIVDAAADLLEAGQHEKSLALLLDAQPQAPGSDSPLLMLLSVAAPTTRSIRQSSGRFTQGPQVGAETS